MCATHAALLNTSTLSLLFAISSQNSQILISKVKLFLWVVFGFSSTGERNRRQPVRIYAGHSAVTRCIQPDSRRNTKTRGSSAWTPCLTEQRVLNEMSSGQRSPGQQLGSSALFCFTDINCNRLSNTSLCSNNTFINGNSNLQPQLLCKLIRHSIQAGRTTGSKKQFGNFFDWWATVGLKM